MKCRIKSCISYTVLSYSNLLVLFSLFSFAIGLREYSVTSMPSKTDAPSDSKTVQLPESKPDLKSSATKSSPSTKTLKSSVKSWIDSTKKSLDDSGGTEPRPHQ